MYVFIRLRVVIKTVKWDIREEDTENKINLINIRLNIILIKFINHNSSF
jgi:hypothetical protein